MKKRVVGDRRKNLVAVKNNRREAPRRTEDKKNIISYYIMVSLLTLILGFMIVISLLWG